MAITPYGNPTLTPFVLSNGLLAYTNPSLLANYGIQANALKRIANDVQNAACVSASRKIDGYISDRYPLPLVAFDYDLVEYASKIAIWDAICNIGFNPDDGQDGTIAKNYNDALEFMGRVQRQSANLCVSFNSPATPGAFQNPRVITSPPRGWEGGRFRRGGSPFGI